MICDLINYQLEEIKVFLTLPKKNVTSHDNVVILTLYFGRLLNQFRLIRVQGIYSLFIMKKLFSFRFTKLFVSYTLRSNKFNVSKIFELKNLPNHIFKIGFS